MRIITYILKSIHLLNVLLVAAVAYVAVNLLYQHPNAGVAYKPPAVAQQAPEVKEEKPAQVQSPPLTDYMVVAEQNIFHPERKIPPEAKDEKALPRPEIFLYGTILADNMRLAYIEDRKSPQSTPGRGRRQTVVKQGDTISGFVVKSVEADRIVLTRGEEQMIVNLTDSKKQREVVTAPPAGQRGPVPGSPAGSTPFATPGSSPVPRSAGVTPSPGAIPAAPPTAAATPPVSVSPGPVPQPTTPASQGAIPRTRRPSVMPTRPSSQN